MRKAASAISLVKDLSSLSTVHRSSGTDHCVQGKIYQMELSGIDLFDHEVQHPMADPRSPTRDFLG